VKLLNHFWCLVLVIALAWSGRGSAQYGDYQNRDRRSGACFFKDADFRGESFCVDAGQRVGQVPPGFSDRISSVRIFGRTEITVYQDSNFGGPSLRLRDDVANLQSYQVTPGHSWNDRISSVDAGGGRDWDHDRDRDHDWDRDRNHDWDRDHDQYRDEDRNRSRRGGACFYRDANFQGERFCVDRGDRVGNVPPGFGDRISSIRIFGHTEVTLYQDSDFRGHSLRIRDDVENLQSYQVSSGHSWNDRVSSVKVY
jgi:Peptidase inhibitor family I36